MLPFPANQSSSDARAWLQDGWFTTEGGEPVRYYDCDSGYVLASDYSEGDVPRRVEVPFSEVRVHWPRCGAVNIGRHAVYVERHVDRQWCQTYRGRLVKVHVPGKWHVMRALGVDKLSKTHPDSYELVYTIFNPSYPPPVTAVRQLAEGEMGSVAVSPHLTLVQGGDGILLYHCTELVAEVVNGSVRAIAAPRMVRRITKHLGDILT